MTRRSFFATCMLAAIVAAAPLCAETYTVDGARGDDANDGINAPFATIARGAQMAGPGDTLRIVPMDEPYRESLRLMRHGLRGAPIVIEGGGATLTGADPAPAEGWTEQGGIWQLPLQAHERMKVFGEERHFIRGAGPANLEPEQWRWEDGTLYFRPADGNTPADYDLRLAVDRPSGVMTSGAGLIIVRDLTCVNFWNDGFNLHGGTGPIWFENIVGNWNGDEGFSAHENAECYVRGGEFSNNYWHGIADIIFSRTHYVDVVCRDNREKGVLFTGGSHSLTDCAISGSPLNVHLARSGQTPFARAQDHPLVTSFTNLRNTVVRSANDEVGVQVGRDAEAVIEHCLLEGGAPMIHVESGGKAFVANSVVAGGEGPQVVAEGAYVADYNLYWPAHLTIAGTDYTADTFADYRAATDNDANALIEEPVVAQDRTHLAANSPGYRGADSSGYGGLAIGPESRGGTPEPDPQALTAAGYPEGYTPIDLPEPTAPAPEGGMEALADGGTRWTWDFEERNPWNRIYPVPTENQAGDAVGGAAELSTEQAHSGAHSGKVLVQLPPSPPEEYQVKLFSARFQFFARPIRRLSFWLHTDAGALRYRIRVRDGNREGFWSAPRTLEGDGWQQVRWDLLADPPVTVRGGDENGTIDGPPMEIVLEYEIPAGEVWTEHVIYVDDLVVELAE